MQNDNSHHRRYRGAILGLATGDAVGTMVVAIVALSAAAVASSSLLPVNISSEPGPIPLTFAPTLTKSAGVR